MKTVKTSLVVIASGQSDVPETGSCGAGGTPTGVASDRRGTLETGIGGDS